VLSSIRTTIRYPDEIISGHQGHMNQRPSVGVGVVVHDGKGNIIMGERVSSHGAGT
jgi:hypothetical protein